MCVFLKERERNKIRLESKKNPQMYGQKKADKNKQRVSIITHLRRYDEIA
jgi:hypothetical protein